MSEQLFALEASDFDSIGVSEFKEQVVTELESGKIVYLPSYSFALEKQDKVFLSDAVLDGKHKNISYNYTQKRLQGLTGSDSQSAFSELSMTQFMRRYAEFSKRLVDILMPSYGEALQWGRTSYRPAEIKGRKSSKRKDDTRLHVDSFPSTPVNGLRILRVFCNINPHNAPRVWNVGDPFQRVLERFSSQIPPYNAVKARLLQWVKATKSLRTPYDHYMLALHDAMKLDDVYQGSVYKESVDFLAQSTWVVFTDQVSHAALSGQYLLEQTFYLPVEAMENQALSPLKQLEKEKAFTLSRV